MTTGYSPRRASPPDRVPELTHYHDDGCHIHPKCLECPLPRCIYDVPNRRVARMQSRDREMARLYYQGLSADAIALRFQVHRRSVFRALERWRDARAEGRGSGQQSALSRQ